MSNLRFLQEAVEEYLDKCLARDELEQLAYSVVDLPLAPADPTLKLAGAILAGFIHMDDGMPAEDMENELREALQEARKAVA